MSQKLTRASFSATLNRARADAHKQLGGPPAPEVKEAAPAKKNGGASRLVEIGLPEKVAAKFAGSFEAARAELTRIAKFGQSLEPWRQKQFSRAIERFYVVLSQQLALAPEDARAAITKDGVQAMRKMIERAGASDQLVPAMFAAIGLVDSGVRLTAQKRLAPSREDLEKAVRVACEMTGSVQAALAGRAGIGTALNLFPNLAEQLERAHPKLTVAAREKIWGEVTEFLAGAPPKRGLDLTLSSELAELLNKAIEAGGAKGALDRARASFAEKDAPARAEIAAAIVQAAPELPAGAEADALARATRVLAALIGADVSTGLAAGAEALRATLVRVLAHGGEAARFTDALARICELAAGAPVTEEVLRHFAEHADAYLGNPAALDALDAAAKAGNLAEAAPQLARAAIHTHGGMVVELDKHLGALAKLDPSTATRAALVFASSFDAPWAIGLVSSVVAAAKAGGSDDPAAHLGAFAATYATMARALRAAAGDKDLSAIAGAIASSARGRPIEAEAADKIAGQLARISLRLPLIELKDVLSESGGRPGLIELNAAGAKYFTEPGDYLQRLIDALPAGIQGFRDRQLDAARVAIALSQLHAQIAGNAEPMFAHVLRDFAAAAANPEALPLDGGQARKAVDVRAAAQAPTLSRYLAAHPHLPIELAFTAGLHLNPEQLAWVESRMEAERGTNQRRYLRDFVLACISSNRLDLLDAARESKSPVKAISAVITEAAIKLRAERAHELPFDQLIEGLRAGGDPIRDIQKAEIEAAFQGVNLYELCEGKVDPAGIKTITSISPVVAEMLKQFVPGFVPPLDTEYDYGPLRAPFLEVLKSVGQGTWPSVKYENEVGRRMMDRLPQGAQSVWRKEMVTPATQKPAEPGEHDAALESSMQILRGLARAIPMNTKLLPVPGVELGWNEATVEKLRALRGEKLEALRKPGVEKGSDAHRKLSGELSAVQRNLSVLELQLALGRVLAGGDPRELIVDLRPLLASAERAVGSMGNKGLRAAIVEVLTATADVAVTTKPKQGRYGIDEDTLPALLTSNTSGCLSLGWPVRIWGLAGASADANIRMLRVMNGSQQRYRAFLKFFPIEMEGYKGMAVWVDNPKPDGGGDNEDLKLLYRHAINKAMAMGLPVLSGARYSYDRVLGPEGKAMGLEVREDVQVKFFIEEGNTHLHHSDALASCDGGNTNKHGRVRDFRGEKEFWEVDYQVFAAVMPPKRA